MQVDSSLLFYRSLSQVVSAAMLPRDMLPLLLLLGAESERLLSTQMNAGTWEIADDDEMRMERSSAAETERSWRESLTDPPYD